MRTLCTLLALFASVAMAAEPAPSDPVRPGAAVATATSLSTSPLPASLSDDPASVSRGSISSSADPVTLAHRIPADRTAEATVALEHLQGERSRLEEEKQLLTLQVDIATLHRKLVELQSTPRSMSGGAGPVAPPVEPPPTVLSRRGFDGHFTAVLRMNAGGKLMVRAGDSLPNGKVEAVDSQGVTVTWYGRRQRLLDAEAEDGNGAASTHSLDLTLPAAPPLVTAH